MTSAFARVLDGVGDRPEGTFLVAVSGGADSAVAAAVVAAVSAPDTVRLMYLDHGLPASGLLGDTARKLATHLRLSFEAVTLTIATGSWENAAREARRNALLGAAGPTDVIVTGHHRNDVTETFLGNLVRGGGARGLSSLRPRSGRFWRPLHGMSRATIRAAADELALPYHDDPENLDIRYRRNAIRLEIIPALEALNPAVSGAIARTAAHLAGDDDQLEAMAAAVPMRCEGGAWAMPVPVLLTIPLPVARRALGRLVRAARPPYGPTTAELARLEAVASGVARSTELQGGYTATREGPMLAIYRPADAAVPGPAVVLPIPGEVDFGERLLAVRLEVPHGRRRPRATMLDADGAGTALEVRGAVIGDRIDIGPGSKAVRVALAEAGVPPRRRPGWPVVTARGKIACLVGVRVASWARAHQASRMVVVISERIRDERAESADL